MPDDRPETGGTPQQEPYAGAKKMIAEAINTWSLENGSNTPDWVLAEFMVGCLHMFDHAVRQRDNWYGRDKKGEPYNPFTPIHVDAPKKPRGSLTYTLHKGG